MVAIGSEVVAASIYCRFWFPDVPSWMWIAGFSAALVYVNARSVGNFGEFEYWFALIKVADHRRVSDSWSRVAFRHWISSRLGLRITPRMADFFRTDGPAWGSAWPWPSSAYLGVEFVAVTAGEASDPTIAVPRALRWTLARLAIFYIGGMAVLVGVMPWTQAGLTESPFVRVFQTRGHSAAAGADEFRGA